MNYESLKQSHFSPPIPLIYPQLSLRGFNANLPIISLDKIAESMALIAPSRLWFGDLMDECDKLIDVHT